MAGIVNAKNHSVGPGRAASGLYRYPSSVWHCVPGVDDEVEDDIFEFALNTVDRLQIRTDGDYQFVGWAKYPAERCTQPFKHLLDLNGASAPFRCLEKVAQENTCSVYSRSDLPKYSGNLVGTAVPDPFVGDPYAARENLKNVPDIVNEPVAIDERVAAATRGPHGRGRHEGGYVRRCGGITPR